MRSLMGEFENETTAVQARERLIAAGVPAEAIRFEEIGADALEDTPSGVVVVPGVAALGGFLGGASGSLGGTPSGTVIGPAIAASVIADAQSHRREGIRLIIDEAEGQDFSSLLHDVGASGIEESGP